MMYSIHIPEEFKDSSSTMKNFVSLMEDKVEFVNKEDADYTVLPLVSDSLTNKYGRNITIYDFLFKLNKGKNRFTIEEKTNITLMTLGNQTDKALALDLMFGLDFREEYAFFQLYLVLANRDNNLKNNVKLKMLNGLWQSLRYIEKCSLYVISPGMIHGKYDLGMYVKLVQAFKKTKDNGRPHLDVLEILSSRNIIDIFLRPYSGYLKFGEITINDLVNNK